MADFDDPAFYGDRWAGIYDEHYTDLDPTSAVEFLAGWAGTGRVLELAIGTGRVALPLAARGARVEGVDASAAMVKRLRAKPGGESIPVTIGDMADVPADGPFQLVYLIFNTFYALLSQDRQAECFRNVARVLAPDGAFVVECFVPDVASYDHGQRVQAVAVSEEAATIRVSLHDAVQQRVTTQVITLDGNGVHLHPVALRYCWPAELDLMAAQAGLRLSERHGDWRRQPFNAASGQHISVYQPTLVA
jgi:SAM-dependent methyltransferase